MPNSRNDPLTFATYAWRNFEFIEQASTNHSHDLHPVTQLVLSLLGLIIFQREKNTIQFNKQLKAMNPNDLLDSHLWSESVPSTTLKELIDNLRHSIAHGNLEFSSESHNQHEVYIAFCNKKRKGGPWKAHVRADHLRTFCLRFKSLLEHSN